MNEHRLFVFGTLKQGFPNYHLNQGRRIDGEFITLEAYPLYLVGQRYSPWMMDAPGKGSNVTGELYLVDDQQLKQLDRLERIHADDGYRRRMIRVKRSPIGQPQTVMCYLKPPQQLDSADIRHGPLNQYTLQQAQHYRSRSG